MFTYVSGSNTYNNKQTSIHVKDRTERAGTMCLGLVCIYGASTFPASTPSFTNTVKDEKLSALPPVLNLMRKAAFR